MQRLHSPRNQALQYIREGVQIKATRVFRLLMKLFNETHCVEECVSGAFLDLARTSASRTYKDVLFCFVVLAHSSFFYSPLRTVTDC